MSIAIKSVRGQAAKLTILTTILLLMSNPAPLLGQTKPAREKPGGKEPIGEYGEGEDQRRRRTIEYY